MPVKIKNGKRLSFQAWIKAISKKRGVIADDEHFAAMVAAMSPAEVERLTKLKDEDAEILNAIEDYVRKHGCSETEARNALDRQFAERQLSDVQIGSFQKTEIAGANPALRLFKVEVVTECLVRAIDAKDAYMRVLAGEAIQKTSARPHRVMLDRW